MLFDSSNVMEDWTGRRYKARDRVIKFRALSKSTKRPSEQNSSSSTENSVSKDYANL